MSLPIPAEKRALAEVHRLEVPLERPAPARMGLTEFDKAPLSMYADPCDIHALVEDVRLLAEGLASEDGDAARVRLLSRALASARAQERILETIQAQALAQRDEVGFRMATRALKTATQRLAMLAKQLSVESALGRRPTVLIGHADAVTFGEEG